MTVVVFKMMTPTSTCSVTGHRMLTTELGYHFFRGCPRSFRFVYHKSDHVQSKNFVIAVATNCVHGENLASPIKNLGGLFDWLLMLVDWKFYNVVEPVGPELVASSSVLVAQCQGAGSAATLISIT